VTSQQTCIADILEPFEDLLGVRPEPEILTLTERNGFIAQRQKYNKRVARYDTRNYKVISKFDVAFNPYLLWAGAIAQNIDWDKALISPLYPTFRIRDGYDPRFVDYLLRGEPLRLKYNTISFGSVPRKRRASVPDFLRLSLPKIPPLVEQRRIAVILDKAEELRTKRRATLGLLDTLKHSIFIDLFGDPVANPNGWGLHSFRDLLAIPLRNGLSPSHSGNITAKVLTLSAITGSHFDCKAWKTSTFASPPPPDQSVDENDFLICRGNGNLNLVGKGYFPTARIPDVTFPDTMIAARIIPDLIERPFLQHIWNSGVIRRQVESLARTTNGTYKVNQAMLEEYL
jgi:type I restriction enzyme S subunit